MALVDHINLTNHMDFVDEDHLRWSFLRISGLHSRSAWLSGDAAMRSTQQPRAQIKTQLVELHPYKSSLESNLWSLMKGRLKVNVIFTLYFNMLSHCDIVWLDFHHLTQLVDVAIESFVRMMVLPHFFSRAKAWWCSMMFHFGMP